MRKLFPPLAIILICLFAFFACKKTDIVSPLPEQSTPSAFFQGGANLPSPVKRVMQTIEKQEAAHPFLETFLTQEGHPVWDKSIIHPRPADQQGKNSSSADDSIVLVPVVKQTDSVVSSFLACNVMADTVLIRFIRDRDYRRFSFGNAPQDSLTANAVAMEFIALQKNVFGDSVFQLKDARLFNYTNDSGKVIKPTRLTLRKMNASGSNGKVMLMPFTWIECHTVVHDGDQGQLVGVPPGGTNNYSYSTTVCTSYTIWYDEGGGNNSGGNPGGGGSGGGWYPGGGGDDPCSGISRSASTSSLPPGDDCGPGWWPVPTDQHGFYYQRIEELRSYLAAKPDGLLPCDKLETLKNLSPFYGNLLGFTPDQAVKDRILQLINDPNLNFGSDNLFIQSIDQAGGSVINTDYFPLKITNLPTTNGVKWTPERLLEYFRMNVDLFITDPDLTAIKFEPYSYAGFDDYQRCYSPTTSSIGSIWHLILPFNNGSVIESNYANVASPTNYQWTFSTIHTPMDGYHPVSGNRRFGIFNDTQNPGSYTFYIGGLDGISTYGIDFLNWIVGGNEGFKGADLLWRNIIDNMRLFIVSNSGSAETYSFGGGEHDFALRTDHEAVKRYLRKEPGWDLAQLRRALGCY